MKRARELTERLKYGIKSELLPLATIRGIGRAHARKLREAWYATPESLVMAGERRVGKVVGQKVAESAIKDVKASGRGVVTCLTVDTVVGLYIHGEHHVSPKEKL